MQSYRLWAVIDRAYSGVPNRRTAATSSASPRPRGHVRSTVVLRSVSRTHPSPSGTFLSDHDPRRMWERGPVSALQHSDRDLRPAGRVRSSPALETAPDVREYVPE